MRGAERAPGFVIGAEPTSPWVFAIRKCLREMAERLADKYEEAKEKQEDLMSRSVPAEHSGPSPRVPSTLRTTGLGQGCRCPCWEASGRQRGEPRPVPRGAQMPDSGPRGSGPPAPRGLRRRPAPLQDEDGAAQVPCPAPRPVRQREGHEEGAAADSRAAAPPGQRHQAGRPGHGAAGTSPRQRAASQSHVPVF